MTERCEHEHRTILKPKWAISTGKIVIKNSSRQLISYNADVDLWYCFDCKKGIVHDWGTGKYSEASYESETERAQLLGKYND